MKLLTQWSDWEGQFRLRSSQEVGAAPEQCRRLRAGSFLPPWALIGGQRNDAGISSCSSKRHPIGACIASMMTPSSMITAKSAKSDSSPQLGHLPVYAETQPLPWMGLP